VVFFFLFQTSPPLSARQYEEIFSCFDEGSAIKQGYFPLFVLSPFGHFPSLLPFSSFFFFQGFPLSLIDDGSPPNQVTRRQTTPLLLLREFHFRLCSFSFLHLS